MEQKEAKASMYCEVLPEGTDEQPLGLTGGKRTGGISMPRLLQGLLITDGQKTSSFKC